MNFKNITNKNKSVIFRQLVIMVILCVFLISALVKIYTLKIDLSNTQDELLSTAEQLDITNNHLNIKTEEYITLAAELDASNEVIESLKGEKYNPEYTVTNAEIEMLAKTVWGEARGCSKIQQSAVVWCILNRVDADWGTIAQVIKSPGQFHGYHKSFPVEEEIKTLVEDVINRWVLEKTGCGNVGRTLPSEYLYFSANRYGTGNVFRNNLGGSYQTWNWDCWNPYS